MGFLLIVVVVSVAGSLVVWLRHRRPTTLGSSVEQFQREMAALAHDPDAPRPEVRRPTKVRPIVAARGSANLADKLRVAGKGEAPIGGGRGGSAFEAERIVDVDGEW